MKKNAIASTMNCELLATYLLAEFSINLTFEKFKITLCATFKSGSLRSNNRDFSPKQKTELGHTLRS